MAEARIRATPAFLAALCAVACAGEQFARADIADRDSAGIRIIENRTPLLAEDRAWKLDSATIEIGAQEQDTTQQLFSLRASIRLSAGRIVIANGAPPHLRWYDTQGRFLLAAGQRGEGPGEFPSSGPPIMFIWLLPGDSIATWEHAQRRMQVFTPDGSYVRAVRLEPMPDNAYPQMVGRFDTAGFAMFEMPRIEQPPLPLGEVRRPPLRYVRFAADGAFAGELGTHPGFMIVGSEFIGHRSNGRPPLARPPVSAVHGDRFFYGSANTYEIRTYNAAGSLQTIVRRAEDERALTGEMIAAHRAEWMQDAPPDPNVRREWQRTIDATRYPDSLPAYRRIRVDRTGKLWVQAYDIPGATTVSWSVFDADGRWITNVTVPRPDFEIHDIGDDYILALVRDELDVERIRLYPIRKPT